jgi:hypothetical protein
MNLASRLSGSSSSRSSRSMCARAFVGQELGALVGAHRGAAQLVAGLSGACARGLEVGAGLTVARVLGGRADGLTPYVIGLPLERFWVASDEVVVGDDALAFADGDGACSAVLDDEPLLGAEHVGGAGHGGNSRGSA